MKDRLITLLREGAGFLETIEHKNPTHEKLIVDMTYALNLLNKPSNIAPQEYDELHNRLKGLKGFLIRFKDEDFGDKLIKAIDTYVFRCSFQSLIK